MAQQRPPSGRADDTPDASTPTGDPWHAFGAIVAGVLVYGLIGWALDRWLNTSFFVVIGILLGAGLGIYMTWKRFSPPPADRNQ